MKIVSLNAFESPLSRTNKIRLKKLTEELLRLKPDIICLQEIIKAKTARRIQKLLQPYGYRTFIQPKRIFNHGGLVCAVKLPVIKHEFTPFKNQGVHVSLQLAERIIKKGYQCVKLQTDTFPVTVFNTHVASIFRKKSKKQLQTRFVHVRQLLDAIVKTKGNIISTGDYNFTPHDQEHRFMEKAGGLTDPLEITYFPTVSPKNTNRKKSFIWPKYSVRHDYTWLSKGLLKKLHKQKIIFDTPYKIKRRFIHLSDHYGILTELKV
ncbi:MAG: hypothetical protein UX14_C0002G0010 [Parcubacteria group bacterium GW2011_GWF1_45_5]|nr:MAG: hypothetical protein UX14_C0002G0010 [Parcubacteria group bacterium GW2011_GWF1_45_5]